MERLESEYFEKPNISLLEHRHRYLWAAAFARGTVCDIACGAGYGAEFLMANKDVTAYVGMDVSDEALLEAGKRFRGPGIHFAKASATDMPIENSSVDTIVSMETLEHLEDPAAAVREFRRVLRPGGLVLGSVPSESFEAKCESCYGANVHHIQRFTLDSLRELLGEQFSSVRLGISTVGIATMLYPEPTGMNLNENDSKVWIPESNSLLDGSIHFVASDSLERVKDVFSQVRCWHAMSFIDYQAAEVAPLRKAYQQCESLVYLKDQNLSQAVALIHERDEEISRRNKRNRFIRWVANYFNKLF